MATEITPCFWFPANAVEAVGFYVSLFEGSSIDRITALPADSPSGPAETVEIVDFTLAGRTYMAMAAGPMDPFNHAISMSAGCADQAEIDRLWTALSDGGSVEQCGWLKDRYGVSWQIVPTMLAGMIADPDRVRARRVALAMFGMVKLDIAGLQRAWDG